jgi:hypothetical protein
MPGGVLLGFQAGLVNFIPYLSPVIAAVAILLDDSRKHVDGLWAAGMSRSNCSKNSARSALATCPNSDARAARNLRCAHVPAAGGLHRSPLRWLLCAGSTGI